MIEQSTISSKIAKDVFRDMFDTGKSPEDIVKEKGLIQISDEDELESIAKKLWKTTPSRFRIIKTAKKALGFLVGQIMKETRGKANPQMANSILKRLLD